MQHNHLNMFSLVQNFLAFPIESPEFADLAQGHSYAIVISNTTAADITSGSIILEGADAKADNPCEPDVWSPLDPVAGCAPIVSGIPDTPPVRIEPSPERPIRAHSICMYATPCPAQFLRVTGVPAGCHAWVVIGNLRRTNFDHLGPLGQIPKPLAEPFGTTYSAQLPSPQRAPAPQQPVPPRRQRVPAE